MPPPNWRHLQVAHTVYRHGGIRKAADHLGLVHSTISRRIADLETDLGVRLFELGPSGLSVNPIIRSLLCELDELSDRLNHVLQGLQSYKQNLDGAIAVSCAPGIQFPGLITVFGEFMRQHPGVNLILQSEVQQMDAPHECGLVMADTVDPSALPAALQTEIATLCGTLQWRLYEGLGGRSQVLYSTPYCWIQGPTMETVDFAHRNAVTCQNLQTVHDAIAGQLGFGWLPAELGDADPRLKPIDTPSHHKPHTSGVFFVLRHGYAQSARHRALRAHLLEHMPQQLFTHMKVIEAHPTAA